MKINVQFADETEQTIISFFSVVQNPQTFPNQGQVEADDPRWAEFYHSIPVDGRTGLPEPAGQNQ